MEQIFDLGPGFWAVTPNMPKMAQNAKIVTHPTVFELRNSYLRITLTYPRAKNSWNRFLIWDPNFGLWPQTCPKSPKHENLNSSHSFWARKLISQDDVDLPRGQNSWNRFLIGAQFLGYGPNMPKMAQNAKILTTLKAHFYCCAAVAPIRSLIALVFIKQSIFIFFVSMISIYRDTFSIEIQIM